MELSTKLLAIADQLRDVAALGLHYSRESYDQERYRTVQDKAIELFALATARTSASFEPLRAAVLSRPTPFVAGDAAIIDEAGRILLIQRADNQLWAMPGGALEVGETPAAGVEREALEETGVRCRATALIGIHDSRLLGTPSAFHLYHLLFLCRPLDTTALGNGSHRHEVIDVRWFDPRELPLDRLDPAHNGRIDEAYRVWRGDPHAYFNRTPDP